MDTCKKIVTHKKEIRKQIKYSTEMCEKFKAEFKEKAKYGKNKRQKSKFVFCACADNNIFSYDRNIYK